MNPYIVDILFEKFAVLSLPEESSDESLPLFPDANYTVCILPSLLADFKIAVCDAFGNPLSEHYSAALAAASFLFFKRGLPLGEMCFETPNGIVEIFNTGNRTLALKVDKCKLLCTNSIEAFGCISEYFDTELSFLSRVVRAESVAQSSDALHLSYLTAGEKIPDAVIFYTLSGCVLEFASYTDHARHKISRTAAFLAAVYTACLCEGLSQSFEVLCADEELMAYMKDSSLYLFWKCAV